MVRLFVLSLTVLVAVCNLGDAAADPLGEKVGALVDRIDRARQRVHSIGDRLRQEHQPLQPTPTIPTTTTTTTTGATEAVPAAVQRSGEPEPSPTESIEKLPSTVAPSNGTAANTTDVDLRNLIGAPPRCDPNSKLDGKGRCRPIA